ncbi:MAG: hypothetical protein PUC31_04140 [Bacteroidales bacterium]|nr:hypothetical protein [Bacteroidales bacterium]
MISAPSLHLTFNFRHVPLGVGLLLFGSEAVEGQMPQTLRRKLSVSAVKVFRSFYR